MANYLIQATELAAITEPVLIVDVGQFPRYLKAHIPHAVHVDYSRLVATQGHAGGALPALSQLSALFSSIGLTPTTRVVAYDDDVGGKASRLLWTLDVLGHHNWALLEGGIHAWAAAQLPLTADKTVVTPSVYTATLAGAGHFADGDYVASRLGAADFGLWDARSAGEYAGADVRTQRGGHIPGAAHLEWTDTMALAPNQPPLLKPLADIRAMLAARGLTPDKEIVTYCQTHHRSSHSYVVLRALGYSRVRGYAGAWSDWGNDLERPIER